MEDLGDYTYRASRKQIREYLKDARDNGNYGGESIFVQYKDGTTFSVGHDEFDELPHFSLQNIQHVHIISGYEEIIYGVDSD